MNRRYLESYRQREFNKEAMFNDKVRLYSAIGLLTLFGIAYGLSYLHKDENTRIPGRNNSFSNRLERVMHR